MFICVNLRYFFIQASLTKDEPSQESSDDVTPIEKVDEEEAIEIKDVDDAVEDQSDNESVVEVVEPEKELLESVEVSPLFNIIIYQHNRLLVEYCYVCHK